MPFARSNEVRQAATRLRRLAFEARRLEGSTKAAAVERVAVTLSHRADTLSRVLQRSEALCDAWSERHAADSATREVSHGASDNALESGSAPDGASSTSPEALSKGVEPMASSNGPPGIVAGSTPKAPFSGGLNQLVADQVEKAYQMSKRFKPATAPYATSGGTDGAAAPPQPDDTGGPNPEPAERDAALPTSAKSARQAKLTTYFNAQGQLHIEPMAYKLALAELPASIPVPPHTAAGMCSSLMPVLDKLNQAVDFKSPDYEAAKNAYASWHDTTWLDARSNTVREKPAKGWTTEQVSRLVGSFHTRYM